MATELETTADFDRIAFRTARRSTNDRAIL
jgi:hypothetical protein